MVFITEGDLQLCMIIRTSLFTRDVNSDIASFLMVFSLASVNDDVGCELLIESRLKRIGKFGVIMDTLFKVYGSDSSDVGWTAGK
jgi:hypothetical protein